MALERSLNLLGQQRVDIPHLRALESSIRADFDLLAGDLMAGGEAMVVRGFGVVTPIVGSAVSTLEVEVADSAIVHPLASVSGGIYRIPADTLIEVMNPSANSNVKGSWTSGVTNYLGVDLRRESDLTTVDTVQFLDPPTNRETPKRVPLAKTLQHRFVISTVDFSNAPHVAPIAIVEVNVGGGVTAITDARQMMFRLGSGGANPDWLSSYSWPGGRDEVGESVFTGGDREIGSFKEMLDAVMTRLWEVGGGEHWYSPTADREVKVTNGPTVLGSGDNWEWTVGTSTLQWADVSIVFGNSPSSWRNTVTNGSAVIPDGSCLYVDLDRTATATLTAAVADLNTLGSPTIPGSRLVLAWRYGANVYVRDRGTEVGRVATPVPLPVATTTTLGAVRINATAGTPSSPVVPVLQAGGTVIVLASSGNSLALGGVGFGTGEGVWGQGSVAGSIGTRGLGTVNNPGVFGEGHGTAAGVYGASGSTAGAAGVHGVGSGANATTGVVGEAGAGTGAIGVAGTSAASNGTGAYGQGSFGLVGEATASGAGYGVLGATGAGGSGGSNGIAALAGLVGVSTVPAARLQNTSTSNGAYVDLDMLLGTDGDGTFIRSTRATDNTSSLSFGESDNGTKTEYLAMFHTTTPWTNFFAVPVTNFGASLGNGVNNFRAVAAYTTLLFDLNASTPARLLFDSGNDSTLPAKTTGTTNSLYAANTCKAWGYVVVVPDQTTAAASFPDGFNVSSSYSFPADHVIRINFASSMQDAGGGVGRYSVHVQVHGDGGDAGPAFAKVRPIYAGYFDVAFFTAVGDPYDVTGTAEAETNTEFAFTFTVHGRQ